MQVNVHRREDAVVVELRGQLVTGTGADVVREVVEEVYGEGWQSLLLDLSAVSKIDSSGIGELVAAYKLSANLERSFALIQVEAPLRRILDLSNLLPLIPVFHSEEEALAGIPSAN